MSSRLKAFADTVWTWIRRHPFFAAALIVIGAAIDVFYELAEELPEGDLGPFDNFVRHIVQQYQLPGLFVFSIVMTDLLIVPSRAADWRTVNIIYLLLPFVIYLVAVRRYILAIGIIVIPSLTGLLIGLLKGIYHRPRPEHELIITPGYSFPSGHAFSSVVIYGLLGYVAWKCFSRRRRQRASIVFVVILLILATGYARVYLGVHYPSDVAGGWIGGLAVLCGGIALLEVLQRRCK